ncbi:hypothetical protein BKA65DRAFT_492149 [Rhexocercosporidium sp. MPI-PUGE-AT-0058]|nr:hypothetical protein BKA65DRAFT_492149 [Rhexocercosporidium sp. MPI-PUGE-AT-0058]
MDSQLFPQFFNMPLDVRQLVVSESLNIRSNSSSLLTSEFQWQFALTSPRVVELEPIYDSIRMPPKDYCGAVLATSCTRYRPRAPYALSITCRESREEALRTFRLDQTLNTSRGVRSHPWIRFDRDIVHFKDLYFAGQGSGFAYEADCVPFCLAGYQGRPALFEDLEKIAMPWEFWRTGEFKRLIQNFFPKLKTLVFLIDDSAENAPAHIASSMLDIRKLYKEPGMRKDVPRFVRDGRAPFEEVVLNRKFEEELLEMLNYHLRMVVHFAKIPDEVEIVVRGCVLPAASSRDEKVLDKEVIGNSDNLPERMAHKKVGEPTKNRPCCSLM